MLESEEVLPDGTVLKRKIVRTKETAIIQQVEEGQELYPGQAHGLPPALPGLSPSPQASVDHTPEQQPEPSLTQQNTSHDDIEETAPKPSLTEVSEASVVDASPSTAGSSKQVLSQTEGAILVEQTAPQTLEAPLTEDAKRVNDMLIEEAPQQLLDAQETPNVVEDVQQVDDVTLVEQAPPQLLETTATQDAFDASPVDDVILTEPSPVQFRDTQTVEGESLLRQPSEEAGHCEQSLLPDEGTNIDAASSDAMPDTDIHQTDDTLAVNESTTKTIKSTIIYSEEQVLSESVPKTNDGAQYGEDDVCPDDSAAFHVPAVAPESTKDTDTVAAASPEPLDDVTDAPQAVEEDEIQPEHSDARRRMPPAPSPVDDVIADAFTEQHLTAQEHVDDTTKDRLPVDEDEVYADAIDASHAAPVPGVNDVTNDMQPVTEEEVTPEYRQSRVPVQN